MLIYLYRWGFTIAHKILSFKLKGLKYSLSDFNLATLLVEAGTNIIYIQKLLGNRRNQAMILYSYSANQAINHLQSPLNKLNLNIE
jgi:hypothetical protein